MTTNGKIPVTVLTGFLGSGKTTLLNRILTEKHGLRIAVIENEFGEIGIDQALVIDADEEVFEMNNGCICCTVRGDLIRILGSLAKRRHKFDHVVVETTGLADPAPVAQTFFVDEEVREHYRLDGIVTLVDAKHFALHVDDSAECKEQVAFADVLVLNKTDLVEPTEVDRLERRLRAMNPVAQVRRAVAASVPIDSVLSVGGFDLSRALETKPAFLDPEYPFEWIGLYDDLEGAHLHVAPGFDPTMSLVVLPWTDRDFAALAEAAVRVIAKPAELLSSGAAVFRAAHHYRLPLDQARAFPLGLPKGPHALVLQHLPEEVSLRVERGAEGLRPSDARTLGAAHDHDPTINSVGIHLEGPIDRKKLERWLGKLLREQGQDIFRMKGVLDIAGSDARFVFQGVHMLFDGLEDRAWGDAARANDLVFIGRKLDRELLTREFSRCLA